MAKLFDLTLTAHSAKETEDAGAMLASRILANPDRFAADDNRFIAFYGDLGVGKTAFIRGLASVIAPGIPVTSPTFALMNEYKGSKGTICHFDMYRITSDDDLYSIGFYDLTGVIIAAEWCENIPYALPPHYLEVKILIPSLSENDRLISIREIGAE